MNDITYEYKKLNSALYTFLVTYITPKINADQILAGSQQNMVLPDDDDYVIFQFLQQIRHGTTTEIYDAENETITLKGLNEIIAKVDCYANSTNSSKDDAILRAQIRANNLNLLFRSSVATDFFKRYNISALYADDAQDTTIISGSDQYLHRWSVNLHLSLANTVTIPYPGFTELKIKPNSLITKTEAAEDEVKASGLHVSDIDVKLKK